MSEQIEISRRVEMVAKAWLRAAIASGRTNDLLASSRALLAQSRQLLAELEDVKPLRMPRQDWLPESVAVNRSEGIPVAPAVHQSDQTPAQHAELSVRVFEDAGQFGWTVYSQANELLGQGTAESELSARVDALDKSASGRPMTPRLSVLCARPALATRCKTGQPNDEQAVGTAQKSELAEELTQLHVIAALSRGTTLSRPG